MWARRRAGLRTASIPFLRMKNKGFRVGLVAALLLLTGYYLWPTLSLYFLNRNAPAAGSHA